MKEMKIDDLKPVKSEEVKEPTAHEKAAEKLKQAARALNETDGNLDATFAAIREKQLLKDIEVLKAECADLKAQRDRMNNQITNIANERNDSTRKCRELRREMSEMQRKHEAEVQDLKDKLDEARADAAVAEKNHARAVGEKNDYADALDDDSIAFEEILGLAILMERGAKSMHEVSKMIQAKTEGRV